MDVPALCSAWHLFSAMLNFGYFSSPALSKILCLFMLNPWVCPCPILPQPCPVNIISSSGSYLLVLLGWTASLYFQILTCFTAQDFFSLFFFFFKTGSLYVVLVLLELTL